MHSGIAIKLLTGLEGMVCRQEAKATAWRELFASLAEAEPLASQANVNLSARECEILERIDVGQRPMDIAVQLGISPRTVETHLRNIRRKQLS